MVKNFVPPLDNKNQETLNQKSGHPFENEYAALIQTSMDGFCIIDVSGRFLDCNAALCEHLGYTREELLQLNIRDVEVSESSSEISEHIQKVFRLERERFHSRHRRKDGMIRDVEVSAQYVPALGERLYIFIRDITERKQAEEALASERTLNEALFNSVPGMIYLYEIDGNLVRWNKKHEQMTGYTSEELSRMHLMDWYVGDEASRKAVTAGIQSLLRTGFGEARADLQKKDGGKIPMYFTASLLSIQEKQFFAGLGIDMTEVKQAEETVQRVQNRANALLENAPDGIVLVSREDTFKYISPSAKRMFGYAADEMILGRPPEYTHPDDLPMVLNALSDLIQHPSHVITLKYRFLHKNGSWRWVESTFTNLLSDPSVEAVVINFRDVTERVQSEEALRKSEQKYQVLTEISPVGIFQINLAGMLLYVNSRWSQITGMPVAEALGKSWMESVLSEDKAELSKAWQEVRNLNGVASGNFRLSRPDGSAAWVEYQIMPEKDLKENVISYVGTLNDITERKQDQEKIDSQLQRLSALHKIDVAITNSFDLKLTLDAVLEQATTQLGMDAASVFLLNPATQMLEFAAGRGFHTRSMENAHLRLDESLAGKIVLERQILCTNAPAVIQANKKFKKFQKEEEIVAYCGVPLILKGAVKGVLEVFNRTTFTSSPEWMFFLTTLAGQAAIAIDNAQLFENLQQSNQELSLAYDATIEGWSHALDLRDKETEGHTLRVTQLTERLARKMGLSDSELIHIHRGALLHDIGKLGVPDQILLKPDKLTGEEWIMMRKHPQFAYDMLSPIPYLQQALDIPYCHHEKWDGTGYPNGLKGSEIPLAARLFAIVDVWDALLSDRPYRRGWPPDQALEYIQSLSGTHFDPEVVKLFTTMIQSQNTEL